MRTLDVLGLVFGVWVVASMIHLAVTLSTWPFRLLAGATALYVAFRLVQVVRSIWQRGWIRT